ncbi:serine protease [Kineosporia babensis]|uniref:Serine protease n=1 Tax=Kineosporia babensis TaxID=499548 RepID=A0A9X1STI3_9ACTN|nr:serine protease [Kineosporia babensis]MCD5310615.1 serine protease [Kineosporia babensis]
MSWISESYENLRVSAQAFDRVRVEAGCADLIAGLRSGAPADAESAEDILELLRRKRYPRLLLRVADALSQNGHGTPAVRRRYAQALIDQEELMAADAVLAGLTDTEDEDEDLRVAGLLGRLHKQLFVLTGPAAGERRAAHLGQAVRAYEDAYRRDPTRTWHGINVVALLARAEREGILLARPQAEPSSALAARVLETTLADEGSAGPWRWAVAFEAELALGRYARAALRLRQYLDSPDTDGFELASTIDQLVEVWELNPDNEPGATFLPPLQAALLRKEGGRVTLDLPGIQAAQDAAALGTTLLQDAGFQSLDWMAEGVQRCRTVARVDNEYSEGIATGFLVQGSAFGDGLPEAVLLTNAHVVPGTLSAARTRVRFRGLGGQEDHTSGVSVLWSSPAEELDATVLLLDSLPAGVQPCVPAAEFPELDAAEPQRLFVIGHPEGAGRPMFSLENNTLLDLSEVRVQYTSATLPGSSGSPVFDEQWQLIAVHHSGGNQLPRLDQAGTHRANEGIRLDAIVRAVRRSRAQQ